MAKARREKPAWQPPVQGGCVTMHFPGGVVGGYAERAGTFTGLLVHEVSFSFRPAVDGSAVVVTEGYLLGLFADLGHRLRSKRGRR